METCYCIAFASCDGKDMRYLCYDQYNGKYYLDQSASCAIKKNEIQHLIIMFVHDLYEIKHDIDKSVWDLSHIHIKKFEMVETEVHTYKVDEEPTEVNIHAIEEE